MKKSYKLLISILVIVLAMANIACLATNETVSGEVAGNDEEIYLGSYEDYENLMNGSQTGNSQEDLKNYYGEYRKQMNEYYTSYTREETVRAKVTEVSQVEEVYEYNDYYYSVSKYEIQPITVEILEGEYIGQEFEVEYLLTGDSLNNITYSEVRKGDTIFVAVAKNEATGEVYADITNTGSNVERFGIVVCLGIFALLILIIYAGKKGVLVSLITLLILDFCLVIIPNMGFEGQGFIGGTIAFVILLIATMSLLELGFNKKALKAMGISLIMTIATGLLIIAANYLTRTVGTVFEVSALSENVLLGNMNFENLYIMITLMIATVAATNVICKTIKTIDNLAGKTFDEKLSECKDIVAANVLVLVVTLFATYIPNHLLLLTNKFIPSEIWNSEILVTELIRLFVIIVSVSLAAPVSIALSAQKEK